MVEGATLPPLRHLAEDGRGGEVAHVALELVVEGAIDEVCVAAAAQQHTFIRRK